MAGTTYNITLTANHQSLTAKYLPLAAESVQYLTAKVVCETEDWTGREIKAMFEQGCTVYEVPVTGGEITAKQQLNLTAGDWRVWLVGNSARDGDVIPRITTNMAHISVAPTGGTEGNPFPATPPTVEEQLRADMGNLADLTTEDKSSLVAAINEARQTGGGGSSVQPDWNQNDDTQPDYVKNRPFYTGDPVETVLVEESTVSFSEMKNGKYQGELSSTFSATVGETYKVYWDGAAYECTCVDFRNTPVIGNLSIVGGGSDTGEPFVMGILNGEGIQIVTADTSASHTFSICVFAPEVVKIDPKYIRDMYYTADPVETVFVEESTATFVENHGLYVAKFPSTFEATVGETYKVSWDGTVYECTCVTVEGLPAIGNPSIIGEYSDTGEPFVMGILNGVGIRIMTADTSASHTFSISGFVSEIVKIDEKYLPYTVATKADVEAVQTEAYNAQTTANNAKSEALDLAARMFGHTSVVDHAFYYDETLSITSLPACIESIGDSAFQGCKNLALTSLPSGLTSIGDYAFFQCTNLALTSLPSGLTSIGDYVFTRCFKLALTSLPSGLTSIGSHAFQGCKNLALTSLPSGLTSIGDGAFDGCTKLALTSLPSGLTSIGDEAFADCTNLALTSLPSGLTSIGVKAFQGCTGLTSITFTGKPTTIGSTAFEGCINLTTINVPWAEGEVANAPWGATIATINYNYTEV